MKHLIIRTLSLTAVALILSFAAIAQVNYEPIAPQVLAPDGTPYLKPGQTATKDSGEHSNLKHHSK